MRDVQAALPGARLAILEAGWPTTASEFPAQANAAHQVRYATELRAWARAHHLTTFFFSAFDEPWKGDPHNALGAEKHWGLFFVNRTPKPALAATASPEAPANTP